ncbi:hypothetical protein [Roseateles sp.]
MMIIIVVFLVVTSDRGAATTERGKRVACPLSLRHERASPRSATRHP